MGIRSSRSLSPEISSSSGRYHYPKMPRTSPVLPAKNKGPLCDSHLAHTAYMNNVARARRSTGTPHSSQLLKPQHLLRRKLPNPSLQRKKNTSPVPRILKSQKRITAERTNYENMDLLGINHDIFNDENCNLVEKNASERHVNAKLHLLQTVYDVNDKATSGCTTDRSNKIRVLACSSLSRELGTPSEVQQKHSVQDLNLQPTFPLLPNIESIPCNNYNTACNNGDLSSVYRNNATQTSPSSSRISNHSSNSYDDSDLMKSVKFPRETAIFYMMHSEEVSQEFSTKKQHGFCRNYSTPEEISQSSSAAHNYCSFQKRRQSKYIAIESGKKCHHPSKRRVYLSEVHYQEAEKPLIDGIIKEEASEQIKNRRKLNIGDGGDVSINTQACYTPEKTRCALVNTSALDKNNVQRDLEIHDRELAHSELGNSELSEDKQITKILSRQEIVSSDHSGFLSWNSCEYQPKEIKNDMKGKPEDGKSTSIPTSRRFSELTIPLDQVLHEQQLRYHLGSHRNKPANVGPNAALTKFHAHGDGFIRPQQYRAQTFCCKHEEELELTGLLVSNRKGTIPRHRSRHDSRRVVPPCPPSTPCSGVHSTEEMWSNMVNAELNEDSPLLTGCVVRSYRKPTSLPPAKKQNETIGEPHSNKTVVPEEITYFCDDFNKCTDLKHAPYLRTNAQINDNETSHKDVVYEEANKLQADVSRSDDEFMQTAAIGNGTNSADIENTSVQTTENNVPTSARTSTKQARVPSDSLVFRATELRESASEKLKQKTVQNKDQTGSCDSRRRKQTDDRHLLMNESQPTCKADEANQSTLHKYQTLENQNIVKLSPDTQEALNQYDREKSRRKQDVKTNTFDNQYKTLDMPFLIETQTDACSNDEPQQNTVKGYGMNSAGMQSSSKQRPANNTSTPTSARTLTKEARIGTGSLAFKESDDESASTKLMRKSAEKSNIEYSHSSWAQKESNFRHFLMDESQPKYKLHEANQSSQDDEKTNSCYNKCVNVDTPFPTEIQRQSATYSVPRTDNILKDKDSTVLEHSEHKRYLERPLRENAQYNTHSQSRSLKHGVDYHYQLSAEAPRREIPVYHSQKMRERAATGDPSNFYGPSPQSTETVVDSSFNQNKLDVSENFISAHNSQHQNVVHQESERDDEERIFQQHSSRIRYCPIHRQHFELPQEEGDILSLHSMDSDEEYPRRRHHLQPQQHYCRIHHRIFTINKIPHEHHLPQNIRTFPESNENPKPRMPSHMEEIQPDNPKRDLSSMAPRCRSLVAMFERQKYVVLSGRNWKVEEEYISAAMNGVNGVNGHHGELNGGGELINSQNSKGCWTIGLINSKFRYLTAETFGFKINANGASLKKKQVWTLEPATGDSAILLRSHLDKYLAVDTFGNVTCETEERDDAGTKFQISVADDGTGRWALRNITRGYFLGASSDKLTCTAKVPGDAELWHVHLAARPQVNLRSVGRKRFAHLSENLDEIHVDANIPWGEDTLFTLEFRADDNGKYALHTCNNKYLSREGKLVDTCTPNCLFSAEYHAGQLALRDRSGAYLSPIGSKAVLKSRSTTVTKDELFSLEDSLPQASFVAGLNSRYVSVKQGVDVTANQDEISDHETFQLEFDSSTKRWYIRTMQDRYWTLETGGGIQASGDKRSSNALFDLVWQGDGSVSFRANNGKFVSTKRSGHLYANCDNVEDNSKYFFYLINRPILVLKCEQGFVGYKSASSPKLECNKATYETIQVERSEKGVVFFKGQNGKYWHVDGESVTADSDVPEGFFIELRDPTHICIKSTSGDYLVASKNGAFRLGDSDYENATKWEY